MEALKHQPYDELTRALDIIVGALQPDVDEQQLDSAVSQATKSVRKLDITSIDDPRLGALLTTFKENTDVTNYNVNNIGQAAAVLWAHAGNEAGSALLSAKHDFLANKSHQPNTESEHVRRLMAVYGFGEYKLVPTEKAKQKEVGFVVKAAAAAAFVGVSSGVLAQTAAAAETSSYSAEAFTAPSEIPTEKAAEKTIVTEKIVPVAEKSAPSLDAARLNPADKNNQKITEVINVIKATPELLSWYDELQTKSGVLWQIFAVLHSRENSSTLKYNTNAQGIFQDYGRRGQYPKSGIATKEEFIAQGMRATEELQEKIGKDNMKYLGQDNLDLDVVFRAMMGYNGVPSFYKKQAASITGSDDSKAWYIGSPYVMNLAGDAFNSSNNKDWKQYLSDGKNLGPANKAIGAGPLLLGLLDASGKTYTTDALYFKYANIKQASQPAEKKSPAPAEAAKKVFSPDAPTKLLRGFPYYYQFDTRYTGVKYNPFVDGKAVPSDKTVGTSGCLIVASANIVNMSKNAKPLSIDELTGIMQKNGYRPEGGTTFSAAPYILSQYSDISTKMISLNEKSQDAVAKSIIAGLKENKVYLVAGTEDLKGSSAPRTTPFTNGGHYITITNIDPNDASRVFVLDTLYMDKSEKSWPLSQLVKFMYESPEKMYMEATIPEASRAVPSGNGKVTANQAPAPTPVQPPAAETPQPTIPPAPETPKPTSPAVEPSKPADPKEVKVEPSKPAEPKDLQLEQPKQPTTIGIPGTDSTKVVSPKEPTKKVELPPVVADNDNRVPQVGVTPPAENNPVKQLTLNPAAIGATLLSPVTTNNPGTSPLAKKVELPPAALGGTKSDASMLGALTLRAGEAAPNSNTPPPSGQGATPVSIFSTPPQTPSQPVQSNATIPPVKAENPGTSPKVELNSLILNGVKVPIKSDTPAPKTSAVPPLPVQVSGTDVDKSGKVPTIAPPSLPQANDSKVVEKDKEAAAEVKAKADAEAKATADKKAADAAAAKKAADEAAAKAAAEKAAADKKAADEAAAKKAADEKAAADKKAADEAAAKAKASAEKPAVNPEYKGPISGKGYGVPIKPTVYASAPVTCLYDGYVVTPGNHTGVDIGGQNMPAIATKAGKVYSIGKDNLGKYTLVLELDDGKYANYQHLNKVSVTVGQKLSLGDDVGVTGYSGSDKQPSWHLHFSITLTPKVTSRLDGKSVVYRDTDDPFGDGYISTPSQTKSWLSKNS